MRWPAIVCFLVTLGICHSPLADTLQFRTLENPPLEYMKSGRVVGMVAELVREAVKRTGHTAEIKVRPWKRVLYEIDKGQADAAFNVGRNDKREQYALFSEEVLVDERYVLFSHRQRDLPADLSGVEDFMLGEQLGYFYGDRFMEVLNDSRYKEVRTDTITKNLKMLIAERTDFFVGDWLPTLYYIREMGASNEVFPVHRQGTDEPLTVSVSPTYAAFSRKTVSPEYVETFDAALREMKEDGTYDAIRERYELPYP